MAIFERVFRHYEELEEFHAGMWRIERGDARKLHLQSAADLMRDSDRFKSAMMMAIVEWPLSAEVALTAAAVNRIAWLGHAGCCLATGSPEEATRAAWHTLNLAEQDEANRVAKEVLDYWEYEYGRMNGLDLFSYMERSNA